MTLSLTPPFAMDCLRFLTRLCGVHTSPDEDSVIEIQATPHVDLSPPQRQNRRFRLLLMRTCPCTGTGIPNPVECRCFYLVRTDIAHSEVEIFSIPVEQFALLEPLNLRLEARAVST